MLEHRPPLAIRSRERLERGGAKRSDLRVAAMEGRGHLLVQGDPEDTLLQEAVRGDLKMALPGPQATRVRGDYALLWMTPKEWLLELPQGQAQTVQATLMVRFGEALAAVSDLSDALACFEVSGDSAPDALMTGCSLDLRAEAFTAGRVARTALADVPAIIWKPSHLPRLRCLIDRSFAEHFWTWLAEAPPGW